MITFIKALFIIVLQDLPTPISPTPPGEPALPLDNLVTHLLITAIFLGCSILLKHKKSERII